MEKNKFRVAYEEVQKILETAEDMLDEASIEEGAYSIEEANVNSEAYDKVLDKISTYSREVDHLRYTLKRLDEIAKLIESFEMDYSDDERKALGL